jgi:hypothetical protein
VEIAENSDFNRTGVDAASFAGILLASIGPSVDNQKSWDLAARTLTSDGYLTNLLFPPRTAELVDDLATVLKKFDARNPMHRRTN